MAEGSAVQTIFITILLSVENLLYSYILMSAVLSVSVDKVNVTSYCLLVGKRSECNLRHLQEIKVYYNSGVNEISLHSLGRKTKTKNKQKPTEEPTMLNIFFYTQNQIFRIKSYLNTFWMINYCCINLKRWRTTNVFSLGRSYRIQITSNKMATFIT